MNFRDTGGSSNSQQPLLLLALDVILHTHFTRQRVSEHLCGTHSLAYPEYPSVCTPQSPSLGVISDGATTHPWGASSGVCFSLCVQRWDGGAQCHDDLARECLVYVCVCVCVCVCLRVFGRDEHCQMEKNMQQPFSS